MRKRIEFEITPGVCISLAALLLLLPVRWVIAATLAAAVHELGHYLAIRLCGAAVYRVRIGTGGTQMETAPMQQFRELICAAAGPAGSFFLLLFAKWLPLTALCGFVQGVFNLLPLFPLDGGRMIRCGIQMLFPKRNVSVLKYTERGILTFLLAVFVHGVIVLRLWRMIVPVAGILLLKLYSEKKTLQRCETGGTIEIH